MPAPHRVHDDAPAVDLVPTAHVKHVALVSAPYALLYVPPTQDWQTEAPELTIKTQYVPGTHVVHDDAPSVETELVPEEHVRHVPIVVAPYA